MATTDVIFIFWRFAGCHPLSLPASQGGRHGSEVRDDIDEVGETLEVFEQVHLDADDMPIPEP